MTIGEVRKMRSRYQVPNQERRIVYEGMGEGHRGTAPRSSIQDVKGSHTGNLKITQHFTYADRIIAYVQKKLEKTGLKVSWVIIVREGEKPITLRETNDTIEFDILAEHEVGEVLDTQPYIPCDALARIRNGRLLFFSAKRGSQLVAGMWCDLDEFFAVDPPRKLGSDEAYLFRAYVLPEYRGQNIAPLLRIECYSALKRMGRTRIYSCTDLWNRPARNFKAKLHCRDEALIMNVSVFGLWRRSFLIRHFG